MVRRDLSTALSTASLQDELPRRPNYGGKGQPITLHTNYFELKGISPDATLYIYSTAFIPEQGLVKGKRRRLLEILLRTALFAGLPIASDWAQSLVTPKKIPLRAESEEYEIEWFPSHGRPLSTGTPEAARKKNTYKVLIQAVRTVSLLDLARDLSSSAFNYALKEETIQALNIIMACCAGTQGDIATVGQNKFYPIGSNPLKEHQSLGFGLEAIRGYFSSVRTSVNRIMVNVNVATGAFYKSGNLLEILKEVVGTKTPINAEQRDRAAAFFRRLKFRTDYGDGHKFHTIKDLSPYDKNSSNVLVNTLDDNQRMTSVTIQQFFQNKYRVQLQEPYSPLVVCSNSKFDMYIPAELCVILPGQPVTRLLVGSQTSEMIKFTARKPHQNAESITSAGLAVTQIKPLDSEGFNVHLRQFGICISPSMLTVPGRILDSPSVQYRQRAFHNRSSWNLTFGTAGPNPFRDPVLLEFLDMLALSRDNRFTDPQFDSQIKTIQSDLHSTLVNYGLYSDKNKKRNPITVNVSLNRRIGSFSEDAGKKIRSAVGTFNPTPKFLFVLLPDNDASIYDSVKYICDVKLGIPTVCGVLGTIIRQRDPQQYFANVAMKFNLKLGGMNHVVDLRKTTRLDELTILFGIDVTHPSPGSNSSSPSIAGVVASVDPWFVQFPASVRTQQGRQEMVADLEEMIIERLSLWRTRNAGRLPNKVIVYRDGVSEGQYKTVLNEEYPAFKNAFTKLYGQANRHPKITIIIVGKRHHTRFYPTKSQEMDEKSGNCLPGTVVDRGVTGEKIYDFFLQPHNGLLGMAKSAHYVVIKDENKFTADEIQTITHDLSYTQNRATRAVSVCPPAFYADRVCERGRSYLHETLKGSGSVAFSQNSWQKDVHPSLQDTMFTYEKILSRCG